MKKFNKNSVLSLSLAAASTIAIGGTVAYNALTHDDEAAVNTYTVGEAVDIALNEYQRSEDGSGFVPFEQGKKLYPIVGGGTASAPQDALGMPKAENYGDKVVTITNTGNVAAKIRVYVAQPLALAGESLTDVSDDIVHWNWGHEGMKIGSAQDDICDWDNLKTTPDFVAKIDGIDYLVTVFTTTKAIAPGAETDAVMKGVYLDANVDYDDGQWIKGDSVIDYDFSKGVHFPVYAEAIAEDATFEAPETVFENWAESVKAPVLVDTAEKINDALESGGTIYLTGDSTIITSDTEINLNNSSISANRSNASSAETYSAMTVKSNVTIAGTGSVENASGYGITVKNSDATLTILDGTYKGGTTAIQVTQGELVIKGGTFEDISTEDNGHYLINCIDGNYKNGTAKVTIMGGTFKNWNPENNTSEGAGTNFLADGYKVVSETNANGDVWYTVVAE